MSKKDPTLLLILIGSLIVVWALYPNQHDVTKPCVVIKHIPDTGQTHCPKVLVRYTNTPFDAEASFPCAPTEEHEHALLNKYPVGSSVTCWSQADKTVTISPSYPKTKPPLNRTLLLLGVVIFFAGILLKKRNQKIETSTVENEKETEDSPGKNAFKLFIFTGVSFIFLCAGGYFLYQEWRAENVFKPTSCKLLDKQITESTGSSSSTKRNNRTYKAFVNVRYQVGEKTFQGWHSLTSTASYSSSHASQQDQLDQYSVGNDYTCWYDPDSPNDVVLKFSGYWGPLFFVGVALLLFITGITTLLNVVRKLEKK